eukprot:5177873-Amphidinium_carterae.1
MVANAMGEEEGEEEEEEEDEEVMEAEGPAPKRPKYSPPLGACQHLAPHPPAYPPPQLQPPAYPPPQLRPPRG